MGDSVEDVWGGIQNSAQGTQNNFNYYLIFGKNNDVSAESNNSYTKDLGNFAGSVGDILNVNALISFKVAENFIGSPTVNPLNTLSPHGDRQVIIYLYLYKGATLIKKAKQVVNFNGRYDIVSGSNGYDALFNQPIGLNYVIEKDGTDYNVSVAITVRAPQDGNFRIMLDTKDGPSTRLPNATQQENDLFQHIIVTKL